jgi:hypothetical protein
MLKPTQSTNSQAITPKVTYFTSLQNETIQTKKSRQSKQRIGKLSAKPVPKTNEPAFKLGTDLDLSKLGHIDAEIFNPSGKRLRNIPPSHNFNLAIADVFNNFKQDNIAKTLFDIKTIIKEMGVHTDAITDTTNVLRDSTGKITKTKLILLKEAISQQLEERAVISSLTLSIPTKCEVERVACDLINEILDNLSRRDKRFDIQSINLGQNFTLSRRNKDNFLTLLQHNLTNAHTIDLSALNINGNIIESSDSEDKNVVDNIIEELIHLKPKLLVLSPVIESGASIEKIEDLIASTCVESTDINGKHHPAGRIQFSHEKLLTCSKDKLGNYYKSNPAGMINQVRQIYSNIEFCNDYKIGLDKISYTPTNLEKLIDVLIYLKSIDKLADLPDFADEYVSRYATEEQRQVFYS